MIYDAVIVGAGLGGCAAGCVLAGAGKKVLLLEKMDFVGGRFSSKHREGFVLDSGSHIVSRCEYGPFTEALKRVGKHRLIGYHHMDKAMIKYEDIKVVFNIGAVTEDIRKLLPAGILRMAGRMLPGVMNAVGDNASLFDDISIKELIDNYLDCVPVEDMLNLMQLVFLGTPYWLSASSEVMRVISGALGALVNGLADGVLCAGFPKGGLAAVPEMMCKGIKDSGGEIRTGSNVTKIMVDDGTVTGVELAGGEVIRSRIVISNAGIRETVSGLVGDENFDSDYSGGIGELLPGISGFCITAALDEPLLDVDYGMSIPVGGLDDYYHKIWDEHVIPDVPPPIIYSIPSNMDPELAPEGRQLMVATGAMMYESNDDYSKMEPLALDTLEYTVPGLSGHLLWHEFSDPGTLIEFGEWSAPMTGIAQCIDQVGDNRPSSSSPIEGLYYVGCEAGRNISGIASEMGVESGIACADLLLESEIV
ncbi:MAG: NAD(P)/FAD-dependent oxidoreductase [Actinobacteria bacterium]|nr:NAD(P)/FAD-dependent oxidoreductase [Actinomycetota bacterium]